MFLLPISYIEQTPQAWQGLLNNEPKQQSIILFEYQLHLQRIKFHKEQRILQSKTNIIQLG
ncbi:unnamed protein product [Paramecium primaurelia]|uniref:Uncharacterized protein n=1 Tax=Paramecium primaurelia TaxID=5886 RepID=A0A8S1NLB9_PARPR|nr:unnamed protein product [Paramecium primaurelia]